MAQLNYYTYLSQSTWLIITYIIYIIIIKQRIIPRIVEIIKINNITKHKELGKNTRLYI